MKNSLPHLWTLKVFPFAMSLVWSIKKNNYSWKLTYLVLVELRSAEHSDGPCLGVVSAGSAQTHDLHTARLEQQNLVIRIQLQDKAVTFLVK